MSRATMQLAGPNAEMAIAATRATSMSHSLDVMNAPMRDSSQMSGKRLPKPTRAQSQFFDQSQQSAANVNVGAAYRKTTLTTESYDNKPKVTSLFPTIWSPAGTRYDQQYLTGDLLMTVNGVDDPAVDAFDRWMNQRTVLNLPQLNREIGLGKKRAMEYAIGAMQSGGIAIPHPDAPDIDMNWLLDQMLKGGSRKGRVHNEFTMHDKLPRAMAEKIMVRHRLRLEREIQNIQAGLDPESLVPSFVVAREIVQNWWDDYDNHRLEDDETLRAKYTALLDSEILYLFPQMIHDRFSFFGTVEDNLRASKFHRQQYTLQGGMTVATGGPAWLKNIFGQPAMPRSRRDSRITRTNDECPLFYHAQLHLVLATSGPKILHRSPNGNLTYRMTQTVVLPTTTTSKDELFARMHRDSITGGRLACFVERTEYKKQAMRGRRGGFVGEVDKNFRDIVYPSEGRSWYLGRVLEISSCAIKRPGFYRTAWGVVDHAATTAINWESVMDCRKEVQTIKLNVMAK